MKNVGYRKNEGLSIFDHGSFLILTFLMVFSSTEAQNQNWCGYSPSHTMCLYPGPQPTCSVIRTGVDPSTSQFILNYHNGIRSTVAVGAETRGFPAGPQPAAVNGSLGPLVWNPTLATVAQRWASQCTLGTDTFRNAALTPGGTTPVYVGQNAYGYIDSVADARRAGPSPFQFYWQEAITSWYNEVALLNPATINNYTGDPATGHYTQLVWGNTTDLGCGFNQWRISANRVARIMVCNYGPGGNRLNRPVYLTANSTGGGIG